MSDTARNEIRATVRNLARLTIDLVGRPTSDADHGTVAITRGDLVRICDEVAEQAAEIARLTAELAAARAVPADVEAAIMSVWQDAGHAVRCGKEIADDDHHQGRRGSPGDQDDCDCATGAHYGDLRAAIARAIGEAQSGAVAYFIDGHAKRLCGQAGEHWTGDGEQLDAWAAKVHDVLNNLRTDAGGTVIDGRASQPATVGGLLATAPLGSIVECETAGVMCQARMSVDVDGEEWIEFRKWFGAWRAWHSGAPPLRYPARLVPADEADLDPSTRGPIGEG